LLLTAFLLFVSHSVFAAEKNPDDALAKPIPIAKVKHPASVDFEQEILPILKNNCLACHNKTAAKAKLILETPQDIIKGGDSGPAVTPNKGSASLLLKAASHQLEDTIMPPRANKVQASDLSPEELGLIKLWIDQGAKGSVGHARPIEWQPLPPGLNPIYAVALTPDGQFAACARANQVFIYHVPSAQLVTRLTDPLLLQKGTKPGVAHRDLVHALAFNPDGTVLASGGYREVKLWRRPENAQHLKLSAVAKKAVQTLAVSPDGNWFATGGEDGNIKLWNAASAKSIKTLRGHSGAVNALKFSPDSSRLCSAGADRKLAVWSVPGGKLVMRTVTPSKINAVTWLNDGRQIASGGDDQIIRLWFVDSARSELVHVKDFKGHTGPVTALDTMPSGPAQILSGSGDGSVRIWNVEDGQIARQVQHGGPVSAVAVRRDGKRFASAGLNSVAKLWETSEGKQIAEMKGNGRAQEYTADRDRFLAFAKSEVDFQKAALKSAETNQTAMANRVKKAHETHDAAEKALAEKQTRVQEKKEARAAAEKPIEELKAELKKAADAFDLADKAAKDAEALAKSVRETAGETKEAIDRAAGEAATKSKTATEAKAALDKLSAETKEKEKKADEKLKAAAKALEDAEKELKKAELTKSTAFTELELAEKAADQAAEGVAKSKEAIQKAESQHQDAETELAAARRSATEAEQPIRSLAFSPDNLTLATAGDDRCVHTWSADNGTPFESLKGHKGVVFSVAFTRDDNPISGAADRDVLIWDLRAPWRLERTLGTGDANSPLIDRINALKFSADGKRLATGGGEPTRGGEIKIFDTASGALSQSLTNVHSDAVFSLDFSADGKYLASGAADKFLKVVDLSTGKVVKQFEGHTHHVLGVSWNWNQRTLASAGADNVVKFWDFVTGEKKKNVAGFDKEVTCINFVGYSDQALAASGDSKVRLIREDGNDVRSFSDAKDFVESAAATPDGRIVIAGGQDSVLRVWNGTNGQLIASFPPPDARP
jgi:WD40 repeat protein